jgi:phage shock protein A
MDDNGIAADTSAELALTEEHASDPVDAMREATSGLAALLPTRVESAVERALEGPDGVPLPRRLADVQASLHATTDAVRRVGEDLARERIGRIQDLEVLVDLVAEAAATGRGDVVRLEERVARLAADVATLAEIVAALAPTIQAISDKLDRRVRISVRTEPGSLPEIASD